MLNYLLREDLQRRGTTSLAHVQTSEPTMPISPADLDAIRDPPPPADVVSEADEAAYDLVPLYVDALLPTVPADPIGAYPVAIPADKAAVLLAHPTLRERLVEAYAAVGWRILAAQGQEDGTFALTLVPPTGRSGPVGL